MAIVVNYQMAHQKEMPWCESLLKQYQKYKPERKIMKKLILVVSMIFGVGMAQAVEVNKNDEPVHVTLVSVDTSRLGADIRVSPSDYPNGVFVLVKEMFSARPVSAAIFAEKLRSKGFKITEKAEDADVTFRVISSTLNFKDIDQSTDSIAAAKVDAAVGVVGTALLTGGFSLLVSDYSFLGNKKPVYSDMSVIVEPGKKADPTKSTFMSGAIKTDASNSRVTRASFEVLTDEWIKVHLRQVESAQPISAVVAAKSMAEVTASKK